MTTVRYMFGSLDNRQIIAELPLVSVSMSNKLNDWGTFRGTMYYDSTGIDNADVAAATIPGRSFLVVEKDDVPIWDGIVWGSSYNSDSKVLNITGRTYEAYADKQIIDVDFIRTAYEQRNIMRELWSALQGPASRNIGIEIPSVFPTVVPRDISVLASEYKTFLQMMSSVADGDNGFDWTIKTIKQNNQYYRQLQIGYPFLGTVDAAGLSFDYPGNVVNYYETSNITSGGTHLFLLGAGEGADMVVGSAVQSDLLATGFKRYDIVVSRKDIEEQFTLNSVAAQLGKTRRAPVKILKVFLKADLEPQFGSYGLGDTATVSIIDPKHPVGLTASARIVAWEYKPQSDDTTDQAELIFEGDDLNDG